MKKNLLSVILSLVLLTACTQVPQNIKERNKQLESTPQAETVVSASSTDSGTQEAQTDDMGDLDYIRSRLQTDASKKYGTITVKHASVGEAKTMPTYKVEVGGNPQYNFKNTLSFLYKNKYDINEQKHYQYLPYDKINTEPTKNDNPEKEYDYNAPESFFYDVTGFSPDKDDFTHSTYYYTDGAVWGSQTGKLAAGEDYEALFINKNSVKYYYPQYDDVSNVSYKMQDSQEWRLTDAIKYMEDFWNTQLTQNDPAKYTYSVWRVDVIPLTTKNYGYFFIMCPKDENNGVYDIDSYEDWDVEEEKVYRKERFFVCPYHYAFCINKDTMTRFSKNFSFKPIQVVDQNDKMLTLGKAMSILENTLSEYINADFETAELKYIITCDKYPFKEYDGTVHYYLNYCTKTCDLYARPYWCFRRGDPHRGSWGNTINYYVDAVTGDVHVVGHGF